MGGAAGGLNVLVLNDIHLGVTRSAGTTTRSQAALADWQFGQLGTLLESCNDTLLINGDLFDKFDVDNATLLRAIVLFEDWLRVHVCNLHLVPGNHDLAKDSSKLSSFHLMASLLKGRYGQLVKVYDSATHLKPNRIHIIPHVTNQDLFDQELSRVPTDTRHLFLHCNYDNHFAEQADHSLNLSQAQAEKLPGHIILGHEHQQRTALGGRVVIVGNQIPTSVADCLGTDAKCVARIRPGVDGVELEPWLHVADVFKRVDWRTLGECPPAFARFVRVEGDATYGEAADVLTAIGRYRARSEAFVVTNAVSIEGVSIMAGVVESLESARSYDVQEAILAMLDDREREVVRRLYGIAS
jgi:hypothetical protein